MHLVPRARCAVPVPTSHSKNVRVLAHAHDGRGVIRGEETHPAKAQCYGEVPKWWSSGAHKRQYSMAGGSILYLSLELTRVEVRPYRVYNPNRSLKCMAVVAP